MAIIGRTRQTFRRISFIGKREVIFNLQKIKKNVNKVMAVALINEAVQVYQKSLRLVPKDTGLLQSTGKITHFARAGRFHVSIRYGGRRAPYAVVQHENPDFHHDPPRQWKYLEKPFKERQRGLTARIGRKVRVGLSIKGGVPSGWKRPKNFNPVPV